MSRDNLFQYISSAGSFVFDSKVAEVFDDMAQRSIPGYDVQQFFMAEYACTMLSERTQAVILDLGCSTGEAMKTIHQFAKNKAISTQGSVMHGVDKSQDMIDRSRKKMAPCMQDWSTIVLEQQDLGLSPHFWSRITSLYPQKVDCIILHFVLPFIELSKRGDVLQRCWKTLNLGGTLLLGEKLCYEDHHVQAIAEDIQYHYKRSHGYSDTQIVSKQSALEGILVPDTVSHFESILSELPHSEVTLYYAQGEFRCYMVKKHGK